MSEPKTPPFPEPPAVTDIQLVAELRGLSEPAFLARWREATDDNLGADVLAHFSQEGFRRSRVAGELRPVDYGD